MKILFVTLHARHSPQATPLAASCLLAALPQPLRADSILIDVFPDDTDETVLATLREHQPAIIVQSIYLWNRERLAVLNRQLRKEYPGLVIIGGGPEATGDPEGCVRDSALTAVIRGAGESALPQLLAALENDHPLDSVPGITFAEDSDIRHTAEQPIASDELTSPWLTQTISPQPGGGVLWEVARGCPFSCDFCFDAGGANRVQALPFERLEQEWQLFRDTGISQLWVLDSTFNVPLERGKQLLRMLLRHPADIHLHFEAKAEHLDHEIVELLAQLPCSVQIGLQSTHGEVLQEMHRPFDFDRFSAGVELLNEAGITFGIDLIYGLPGDSYDGFKESIERVLSLRPNHLDLFALAILHGTALAKRRAEFGIDAQAAPPYTLIKSNDFSATDIAACDQLAHACGLFYNTGRAVGFLPMILNACAMSATEFLEGFWQWLTIEKKLTPDQLTDPEAWSPATVLPLQQGYLAFLLTKQEKKNLQQAVEDLFNDHYHGAEAMVGPETLPPTQADLNNTWSRRWRLSETIRLVDFHYEIEELQAFGEGDLKKFVKRAKPTGSTALYMRRGGELICESLSDEFALLLKKSNGSRTPKEIIGKRMSRAEGEELVAFAVAEGLLTE